MLLGRVCGVLAARLKFGGGVGRGSLALGTWGSRGGDRTCGRGRRVTTCFIPGVTRPKGNSKSIYGRGARPRASDDLSLAGIERRRPMFWVSSSLRVIGGLPSYTTRGGCYLIPSGTKSQSLVNKVVWAGSRESRSTESARCRPYYWETWCGTNGGCLWQGDIDLSSILNGYRVLTNDRASST